MGNAKKANTTPKRYLKEIRDVESTYNIGDTISASVFSVGEIVDVTGTTKGKVSKVLLNVITNLVDQ